MDAISTKSRSRRAVGISLPRRDGRDRRAQHRSLGFGFRDAAALDCSARGVDDCSDHREVPGDGEIAPKDALFLAAFDQRLELVEHGDMTSVELLC